MRSRLTLAFALVLLPSMAVAAGAVAAFAGASAGMQRIAGELTSQAALASDLTEELRDAESTAASYVAEGDRTAPARFSALAGTIEAEMAQLRRLDGDAPRSAEIQATSSWRRARSLAEAQFAEPMADDALSQPYPLVPFHAQMDAAITAVEAVADGAEAETAAELAALDDARKWLFAALAALAVVAVGAAGLLGRHLHRSIARPLQALQHGTQRLALGEPDQTLDLGRLQEFAAAATAFNSMAERLDRSQGELRHLAYHDAITGVANRALMGVLVDQCRAAGRPLAVLVIDLDGFETVNDTLGHSAGDEVLIKVAGRIDGCLPEGCTLARIDGVGFAVLMPGAREQEGIAGAHALLASVASPIPITGGAVPIRGSVGIALAGPDDDGGKLLRNADLAMRAAKSGTGDRYRIFEPAMHDELVARRALEEDLRRAVDGGQLVVHYQPTVTMASAAVVGVEALVRWQHPTRGLVPPMAFIPMAEANGLIVDVGRHVLDVACRQVRQWQLAFEEHRSLILHVNVSPRQLTDQALVATVAQVLAETGFPPECLTLEITESAVTDEDAVACLFALKQLGVRLALDDFGTGYSSLAYVERLPIDVLKIDKSFVDGLDQSPRKAAVCRSVIRLAASLGFTCVAEGVETPAQLAVLRYFGCEQAQGYLFSRPLPADALSAVLEHPGGGGASEHRVRGGSASSFAREDRLSRRVKVEIGPMPSAGARAWISYARSVVAELRDGILTGVVPEATVTSIESYLSAWDARCDTATFHWVSDEDREVVTDLVEHWFRVAEALEADAVHRGYPAAPKEGEAFYEALVASLLKALAAEGQALEALADELYRSWPKSEADQSVH